MKELIVRAIYRHFLPYFVWLIYKLLSLTWRVSVYEPEELVLALRENKPVVFAHWHGDELVLLSLIGHYRIATITSQSIDGDLMTKVVHLVGGKTTRGSSTRGGISALKGLIRLVNQGRNCSFAVDGPKGPLHQRCV